MELVTKRIQTNVIGKTTTDQFVIDGDYNVPESKNDVGRVIAGEGTIKMEEIRRVENYLRITGKLEFKVLYVSDMVVPELESLKGQMPFEEMVYLEPSEGEEYIANVNGVEFSARVIHSRKLELKALVELAVHAEQLKEEELTIDVEEEEGIYKKKVPMELLELHSSKRDTFRIKEEITIPGTKENIGTLIWNNVSLQKIDTKITQDTITFTGNLQIFIFYKSDDEKTDWVEQAIPFEGKLPFGGIEEGFYHHVYHNLSDVNVEVRLDSDGEMRALGVEATLEMRALVYEEKQIAILEDVYSLRQECVAEKSATVYEELLTQNHSKYKLTERVMLPEIREEILQICHSSGRVQMERMEVQDNGILIEGVLHIRFLYVKANDSIPFGLWSGMIPFSYLVESPKPCRQMRYDITANVEQLTVDMAGGGEIEVKAVLAFQSFLRCPVMVNRISKLTWKPFDETERKRTPGMWGYIVKEKDDLWTLAKQYKTTEESIMEVNQLSSRELVEGQKLLIFKQNLTII